MKVIILGKGSMLANLIEGTRDSGCDIVGIFRHERTSLSPIKLFFKDFFKSSPEYTLINKYNLHEIKCKSANSDTFLSEALKLNPDIILVGTWREKLKKEIIDLPKIGTVNVHPSLLPKYRGPNPYIQTILHGENQSGITFHLMGEEFDSGPILAQYEIDILPGDTAKDLKEKTVFYARLMTTELLKKLNTSIVEPRPQNEEEATYFPNITGEEKMLDFENMTADKILNTIRALHPYLPTYITYGNLFFVINPYKARIVTKSGSPGSIIAKCAKTRSLTIACKDQKCVKMSDLKLYRLSPLTKLVIDNIKL